MNHAKIVSGRIPFLAAILALLTSCIGAPFPLSGGKEYLEQNGYAPALIAAVTTGKKIPHDEVVAFSRSASHDVRFLVAMNPTLSPKEIELFIAQSNWFVRAGTAWNKALTREQMERLARDRNSLVVTYLTQNDAVPQDLLLRIYREKSRRITLSSFAANRNCPPEIAKDIEESNDELAKQLLKSRPSPWF